MRTLASSPPEIIFDFGLDVKPIVTALTISLQLEAKNLETKIQAII